MTREQCEKLITQKAIEIRKIAAEYMERDPRYIGINVMNNYITVANNYWEDDKDMPLAYSVWLGENDEIIDEVQQ